MRYIIEIDSQTLPRMDEDFHRTDLVILIREALSNYIMIREDPQDYIQKRYAEHAKYFQVMKLKDIERTLRVVKYLLRHAKIDVDIRKG